MRISIGLPATIPGTSGRTVIEWAKRADSGPFASLGIIDRIAYPNYEPLASLAAAAAVTNRIRLMTTILLAPARPVGLLAKQAATIDVLSGGRLTLALGVGGREDDYVAAGAPFKNRGRRFEEQLATMKRIWSGEPLEGDVGRIGPSPIQAGGPPILLGAYSPRAIRRAVRWGEGFISGGLPPDAARQAFDVLDQAWKEAGRSGKPRFVTSLYCAVAGTPEERERAAGYIEDYYAFLGPAARDMARALPTTPEAIKAGVKGFEDVGSDELILWPCLSDLEQVERLAALV